MILQIEKVVYGGSGLARPADGSGSIFVPFTLPGETVEAQEIPASGGRREAELLRILEPSSARTGPACAHFGHCGGCHYQHAVYEEQLTLKRSILRESLERAGLTELPEITSTFAGPWGYRNRIRLRIAEVDGAPRVGYLRRGSADFLPVRMCPIAAPLLWRAAETLVQLQDDAKKWLRSAVEVEFFTNSEETKLQMLLFVNREPAKGFAELCEALRQRFPNWLALACW